MFSKSTIGNRKCLKLFQSVRVAIAGGSATEDLIYMGKMYGEIEPLSGYRLDFARKIGEGITHKVKAGYFSPVPDKSYTVLYGDRRFTIEAVINPDESNSELHFYCKELR